VNTPRICAAIITRNEEKWIEGCLKSLCWADEIIIMDAYSEDNTCEIARKCGAKVLQHEWDNFKSQRNRLFDHVDCEWMLVLDADERATPPFREAVLAAVAKPEGHVAFEFQRRNVHLGKEMKHGGWFEYHTRLFLKDKFRGWERDIHEVPIVDGPVGRLEVGFLHFSHRNIVEMLVKTIQYSRYEAEWRKKAGFPQVTPLTFAKEIAGEIYRRGIRYGGFLDGVEGWMEIIYQSFSTFITYARLWELQRSESLDETYMRLDKENMSRGQ